jgi:hypothetical protein
MNKSSQLKRRADYLRLPGKEDDFLLYPGTGKPWVFNWRAHIG